MTIDPLLAIASFGIGIVVGLTLMTPVLVLFFNVPPLTAVSSDLVASAVMKRTRAAATAVPIRSRRATLPSSFARSRPSCSAHSAGPSSA